MCEGITGHAINKAQKYNGQGIDLAQTKSVPCEVPDSTGKQKPGGLGMKAARLVKGMDWTLNKANRVNFKLSVGVI